MAKSKKTYYRVETFALGDTGGGCWEDAVIVSGNTPDEAYANVLTLLTKQGFAFEVNVTLCDKHGDDFA